MRKPFTVREYVRWADVDPAGIIRYDAYTRFFELAESELFRSVGVPYREIFRRFQVSMPRRVMHMDFHTPPVLDEELTVRAYITRAGRTSLTMQFDVSGDEGQLRADGYLVIVCVSIDGSMQTRPWPEELLALLQPFVMTADEARSG
jgi:4-hydroxybenzoyl-CoA thioesterase